MIYIVENLTDVELTVTLSGDTSYNVITVPPKSSVPIQKPDNYKIIGDLTSFNVIRYQ